MSQSSWTDLKLSVASASVDDVTVLTSVEELARLKKVMGYIEGVVTSLEPELVPLTVWGNFNNQVNECLQQLKSYESTRNIGSLEAANSHLDNLLSYIRPYMVIDGKIGRALQNAAKEYSEAVNQSVEKLKVDTDQVIQDINTSHQEGRRLADSLRDIEGRAQGLQVNLFGVDENSGGIDARIKTIVQEIEKINTELASTYEEIIEGKDDSPSIKSQIETAKDEIEANKNNIILMLDAAKENLLTLGNFYEKVVGKKSSETGKYEGGLDNELDIRISALAEFEKTQSEKYKTLNKQIEDLLPGATSAGLASAYQEMKNSFNKPIDFYTKGFYTAITVLIFGSLFFATSSIGGNSWVTLVELGTWDDTVRRLISKAPFYGPVLWLAYFFSKRRSESQRLQQEYAHKEALAKSYDSYKKQILALDESDVEMQKAFIVKTIDAIAYNASATLDAKHGDKLPAQELIEKLLETMAKKKIAVVSTPE
ncbi:hypothetical protein VC178_08285 [Polynucleobacter sp. AP-Sanab-80-C2]|uniref:hypothetical protein n=1 Tax=Polynucleobacter sp. AP-Sanab-80-C2 TaxID=3108274 RepID=UPI002B230F07|nr:hypothetical protein [Polynucleobacter sp. AP-Sanab-80-C2]MEA9599884.1 hypothetical protein [Polynucleobacter sp. AP-Sanab-80-C2]